MSKRKAHKLRQDNQEAYDSFNIEPTDGFRSRLEALWVAEFDNCDSLQCVECVKVPVWIEGPFGKFLSNYVPDLVVLTPEGRVFVELKPNHDLAMADDRQKRALELNPKYLFVVIGGYPWSKKGVTVRMLTGKITRMFPEQAKKDACYCNKAVGCHVHSVAEIVHKKVPVNQVLALLGCGIING